MLFQINFPNFLIKSDHTFDTDFLPNIQYVLELQSTTVTSCSPLSGVFYFKLIEIYWSTSVKRLDYERETETGFMTRLTRVINDLLCCKKRNCTTSEDHMTRLCYISLRARGAYLSRVYYRLYPSGTNKRPLLSMRYYTIVTTKLYLKYSSPYSMWRAIRVCVASSQRFTWRMIVKLFTFATFVIINFYTPFLSPRTSRCVVCLLSDSLFNAI